MRISVLATTAFLLGSALTLTACLGGGGGSGGGGGGGAPVPFTSWNQVQPDTTVVFDGTSQEVTVEFDPATGLATSVGPISSPGPAKVTSEYTDIPGVPRLVPINSNINTSQSSIKTGDNVLTDIPAFTPTYDIVANDSLENFAAIADPFTRDWNYQTYGIWERNPGNGSAREIYASFGSVTPNSSVPDIGTATYNGDLLGEYIAPDGSFFLTSADVSVDADFATASMDFQSSNTVRTADGLTAVPDGNLDLSGTLSGAPGSNSFSGALTNTGANLNGSGNAILYGPNVEEVGGTFALKGNGVEAYAGAFGASQ